MSDKPVQTVCGAFDRNRLKALKKVVAEAEESGVGREEVTMFEGQELVIGYGKYLIEFVEMKLGQRNTRGL